MTDFAIHIMVDQAPANPFQEWYGLPPILVAHLDRGRYSMTRYDLDDRCPEITESMVRKRWREILGRIWGIGSVDWYDLARFARDEMHNKHYPLWRGLADAFSEWVEDLPATDRLEAYAEAYDWLGCPAYVGPTSGCSQGDYAEVLVVWTKEWMDKVGIDPTKLTPEEIERDQSNTVDLYGAWAWGDVYGWTVTAYDPDDEDAPSPDDEAEDGTPIFWHHYGEYPDAEVLESCGGYYGTDHKESGLLEDAVATVEALRKEAREEAKERAYWEAREVMTVGV